MSGYAVSNWVAWVLAFALFGWLLYDFITTERKYSEDIILARVDEDEFMVNPAQEGGRENE
jgi:hypothetical protein